MIVDTNTQLNLGGYDNEIASLAGSGTVTTSDGPAVLTVGSSTADSSEFDGVLQDGSTTVPWPSRRSAATS